MNSQPFAELPSYSQLPVKAGAPARSAWGVFGDDDQLGCLNLLTPERIVEAARLVRKGAVFPLNLPVTQPDPPLFGRKPPQHHHLITGGGMVRDDYIDGFWPQAGSQWDALKHMRHPQDGLYNGVRDEDVGQGEGSKLGIEGFARRGIVGRGVLLDIARHFEKGGRFLDPAAAVAIGPEDLGESYRREGVEPKLGDVLLVRTGWLRWYLNETSSEERARIAAGMVKYPGLAASDGMSQYLWDLHIAAVAADNPGVEVWPPAPGESLLHLRLLPHLGIPIGELWYLEDLAEDCAADGVYEFMLASAPMDLPGGAGSPANALAIK